MTRPLLTPSPVAVRQRNLASAAWWREHARKATSALRRQFIANAKAALERARKVSP